MSSTQTPIVWTEVNRSLGISAIDHLFNRLDGIYGERFRKGFTNTSNVENWKSAWTDGLSGEGITFDEVKVGLSAILKMYDWPPTLPEFIKACRPSLDYEAAFTEAVREMQNRRSGRPESWSNPCVYWAAVALGNDLMAYPYQPIKARWKSALDASFAESRNTIPEPAVALPAPNKTAINREEAHRRIQELAGKLRL